MHLFDSVPLLVTGDGFAGHSINPHLSVRVNINYPNGQFGAAKQPPGGFVYMVGNQINFDITVSFEINHDEVGYVSHCPQLDIFSQGTTEKEAIENLKEAITLFLESCFTRGTLFDVLKECGYAICEKPKPIENEIVVHIPLDSVARDQRQAQAA